MTDFCKLMKAYNWSKKFIIKKFNRMYGSCQMLKYSCIRRTLIFCSKNLLEKRRWIFIQDISFLWKKIVFSIYTTIQILKFVFGLLFWFQARNNACYKIIKKMYNSTLFQKMVLIFQKLLDVIKYVIFLFLPQNLF